MPVLEQAEAEDGDEQQVLRVLQRQLQRGAHALSSREWLRGSRCELLGGLRALEHHAQDAVLKRGEL